MLRPKYDESYFQNRWDEEHFGQKLTLDTSTSDDEISCERCISYPANQLSVNHVWTWLCDVCRDRLPKADDYQKVHRSC